MRKGYIIALICILAVTAALFVIGYKRENPVSSNISDTNTNSNKVVNNYRCVDPAYVVVEDKSGSAIVGCSDGSGPFSSDGDKAKQYISQGKKLNGIKSNEN